MASHYYHELARTGRALPMATDLVLNGETDPESVRRDGVRLGRVIEATARLWGVDLAMPLMDLRLEKADMLACLGIDEEEADRFHFTAPLDAAERDAVHRGDASRCAGSRARDEAIDHVRSSTPLLPVGMTIGPFSLATKLMADPITAAALMGSGVAPEADESVRLLCDCVEAAEATVHRSIRRQLEHGAKAILLCEPAANVAFLSPRQMRAGSPIFERLVMEPNERLRSLLRDADADLIFHDCGELTPDMVRAFGTRLEPAVLSLGSSRSLWDDAKLVPRSVVLYGNLPSKSFYSDADMPVEVVSQRASELVQAMKHCGHPHILGTECDVLHVPGAGETIWRKVEAMSRVPAQ